jgi:hypothetical protein
MPEALRHDQTHSTLVSSVAQFETLRRTFQELKESASLLAMGPVDRPPPSFYSTLLQWSDSTSLALMTARSLTERANILLDEQRQQTRPSEAAGTGSQGRDQWRNANDPPGPSGQPSSLPLAQPNATDPAQAAPQAQAQAQAPVPAPAVIEGLPDTDEEEDAASPPPPASPPPRPGPRLQRGRTVRRRPQDTTAPSNP